MDRSLTDLRFSLFNWILIFGLILHALTREQRNTPSKMNIDLLTYLRNISIGLGNQLLQQLQLYHLPLLL